MIQPPVGTVTFLFTDIEGSTILWQQHPDAMTQALSRHHTLLNESITSYGGYVFQIIGDAFCAAFSTANDGLNAALDAQRALAAEKWGETGAIRVRMALHTGIAEIQAGEYTSGEYISGLTMSRAARLLSAGHGGQILLSLPTSELVHDRLPEGVSLIDLGSHRLKDLVRPEQIYQVAVTDLPQDFPHLKTLDSHPHNLPVQLTSFIGRSKELTELIALLAEPTRRMLTLIGTGGTGKTRLALQLAADRIDDFEEGAWFVDLSAIDDPQLVLQTVCRTWELRGQPGYPLIDSLKDYLRHKRLLLILDNCEHLLDICAHLSRELLENAPGLRLLATSRELLGVPGEVLYRLPALSTPDMHHLLQLESLSAYDSVRLFIDRAQLVQPDFRLTYANAPAVAQICVHLDGIPLAIELAAARMRTFSPDQICARLENRFRLLTGGSRTNMHRQQTLQAAIDWSFNLLPELERRLFQRLAVFAGGWSYEAAEEIGQLDVTLDLLESLINKSLVVVDQAEFENRYRYLETIRQYAYEKLVESGNLEITRQRHFEYYLALIKTAEVKLRGPDMLQWLDRLELEQDNLRNALAWALDTHPIEAHFMLAALCYFWDRRASVTEGLGWIKVALESAETSLDPQDRSEPAYLSVLAKVLAAEAALEYDHGDSLASRNAAESSASLARQVGDERTLAWSLSVGAKAIFLLGDVALANTWAKEAFNLSRQQGYYFELGLALSALQMSADPKYLAELITFRIDALPILRQWGNPWVIALNTFDAAVMADKSGNFAEAQAGLEETAKLFRAMRDRQYYAASRSMLAHSLRQHARYPEALAIYRQTIQLWVDLGHLSAVAHELECFAFIAVGLGESQRACVLLGAAQEIRIESGTPMSSFERIEYEQILTQLRKRMDEVAFDKSWSDGRLLTIEQAITFARQ